jgi:Zn-finger nucleic acid-binding protein
MGRAIVLDQCPSCGGIWFDQWELYQTNDSEVENLDPVDTKALRATVPLSEKTPLCPKCNGTLFKFTDPLLPSDAHILRCPSCKGLWLNRGEFRKFKKLRKERLSSQPKQLPPEVLAIMQKNLGNKEFWQNMAVVVIFGLSFATILTLVVVPSLYVMLSRLSIRLGFKTIYAASPAKESIQSACVEREQLV